MNKNQLFAFILLFCCNPFLGTFFLLILKLLYNKREKNSDFLLFIFITLFACLLQSTRIWNVNQPSDWYGEGYWGLFLEVKNTSLWNYLSSASKEPLWRLLSYIGYYITGNNYLIFANFIALSTFVISGAAIYRYWRYSLSSPLTLIGMLFLLFFFTEYWGQVNNLLRQFFAMSIVTYVYVNKLITGKIKWKILICACLIHTFSFIFLFLLLCKPFYKIIRFKQVMYIASLVLVTGIAINHISIFKTIFAGVDFLAYGFERIETAADPTDQNRLNSTSVYITAFFISFICLSMNYYFRIFKWSIFYTNILLAIMLICIFLVDLMPEIMSRIYVSRFYIFPFVLPFFLIKYKGLYQPYIYGIILFFGFRFLIEFNGIRGGGFFPPISDLLTRNLLQYFL